MQTMKKIFSLLIGALMLIGLNSCEKDLEVTEANIVGQWEMTSMIVDGVANPAEGNVWELTEDHRVYVYESLDGYEKVDAGKWALKDKTLYLDFIPWPMVVAELTKSEMELEAYDPDDNILMFSYTFEKVK